MKKKLGLFTIMLMLISIIVIPYQVHASYTSQTLEEVFKEEGISYDFSNYQDSSDKITIYLFRGHGCSFCSKFLNYLANSLLDEYGQYFNVVSYEVWYDSDNWELMQLVGASLGEESVSGVPYIVIGNTTFGGYTEEWNSDIEAAILAAYNSTDRYDVMSNLDLSESNINTEAKSDTSDSSSTIIIWCIVIDAIIACGIILYVVRIKQELESKIEAIKTEKNK